MSQLLHKLQIELRNKEKIHIILKQIEEDYTYLSQLYESIPIMHVCGTHEDTLMKNGLRYLLHQEFPKMRLIAGPGCPVCVSPVTDIDLSLLLATKIKNSIITSYGDMVRVPGSYSSLEKARYNGAEIKTVYSVSDAVKLAHKYHDKEIIFISPGFETTAPATAIEIQNEPPENFSVLSSHRLVPPALDVIMSLPDLPIKGFILPGHVSVIIGSNAYTDIVKKWHISCAIAGFEPVDMIMGLASVLHQIRTETPLIDNAYPRAVTKEGNIIAKAALKDVFTIVDASWRGLGTFPKSGLEISDHYEQWNVHKKFEDVIQANTPLSIREIPPGCSCPEVVIGRKEPEDCKLYMHGCTPEKPIGPCMVGLEGTCRIRALYGT